jgi:hypothetical protein
VKISDNIPSALVEILENLPQINNFNSRILLYIKTEIIRSKIDIGFEIGKSIGEYAALAIIHFPAKKIAGRFFDS